MANRKHPKKAKTVDRRSFRPETPQGRFISWLAGMVAEKLALQDFHQKVIPNDKKKLACKKLRQDDKSQC